MRSKQTWFRDLKIILATGGLAISCGAAVAQQAQAPKGTVPDAQIEANVLKALASAPQLANQNISSTTVYGTVTLSGSVQDEASMQKAEDLTSRVAGVKKVVDEMTIGAAAPSTQGANSGDGSMAPPPDQRAPDQQGQAGPPPPADQPDQVANEAPAPPMQSQAPAPAGRRGYAPPPSNTAQAVYGAQRAGDQVTIAPGALIRIRINEGLTSNRTVPGTAFDGIVLNDVVADGAIAIPRGATIQGTVLDAKKSGALKGRGELSLQLTNVVLAGRTFPIVSDVWTRDSADKTVHTVNNAIGLGALGAIIGAVAGGGTGAAIGAGVGAGAGIASSAGSPSGQVMIRPEAILTFHTAQPTTVTTVSQAEMDRLGYGVPNGAQPAPMMRRAVPPPGYYGPRYYP